MADPVPLGKSVEVQLDADGNGTAEIGPGSAGPANWSITGVILQTTRPGKAPVPRAQLTLGTESKGITYDGSFANGAASSPILLTRGQVLECEWRGGQLGDVATMTVAGEQW
ncbi:hypothetical protein GA0115240_105816 [Streptomyces sp. DvalAA-14]|uniref:hypothetical protein n=1 Tax=unclassified Streptomyces TaxID=2593676 RepID=UPI00081B338E|nr:MULTISPECIES: hypothetical protein [unclassified Streptomyces]MYS19165.1 hypothetical protein [Streptomyces sp. SID4948]SCD38168.1 hypothetical protein GA0115240_105816 [Streptomyces sp. DvalAA-14]